jgi:hypothetical protein
MKAFTRLAQWSLGLVGAAAGGILGYFVFFWMARQGFYALVLPGAALGLGCALLSGGKSYGLGIVCGLLGVVLGLLTEWRFAPFVADSSLSFFLTHLGDLSPLTLASIGIGGVFAFWLEIGSARLLPRRGRETRHCENGKDAASAEQPQSPATPDHLR